MFTHLFQPLGSTGTRLGQTGQVHNAMFNFNPSRAPSTGPSTATSSSTAR